MAIPADKLSAVFPGVLASGGAAIALTGLLLTNSTAVPIGTVQSFSTPDAVAAFFGASSDEYSMAGNYFAGFDNSTAKPGALLFSQYATAPVAGYLRSGSFAGVPLATLQAIASGTLTVTVDGVVKTSSAINLAAATSYSNAATLIAAAFTGPSAPVVAYDSQRSAFTFTSPTTGANSLVSFGSGPISTALKLTQAAAAVTSAGSIAMSPAAAMVAVVAKAVNWASFSTTFEPLVADKVAFGTWCSQQKNRYAYVPWDTDANAVVQGNTTAYGPQAKALGLSGSYAVSGDPAVAAALGITMTALVRPLAAFAMGIGASLDFDATNGRQTWAYRSQGGIVTGVTDAQIGDNLIANGYNFYGAYATANQQFMFMQPGQIGGSFKWADSYFNQIWLNANLQTAGLALMANSGSLPYTAFGYSAIESGYAEPIASGLNFGAIRAGVTLSADQIIAVNASVGKNVAGVIATRGWYLNIGDASASVRIARGSPPMTFFYADGQSIQKLELGSINIQ